MIRIVMLLFEQIKNLPLTSRIRSALTSIRNKLTHFFNPLSHYESELDTILAPRNQVETLYKMIVKGRNSSDLISAFEEMAVKHKTAEKRGKANLLLSTLYKDGIVGSDFSLQKNSQKADLHWQLAVKELGPNPVLSEASKQFIECIKLGGEPQYAFKKLVSLSEENSDSSQKTWSSKVLSYLFRMGFKSKDFTVEPNADLAKKYRDQSHKALLGVQEKLNSLIQRASLTWFRKNRAFGFIKKIADIGHKEAKFHYAEHLRSKKQTSEVYESYYRNAAEETEETPFDFESKGNIEAQKYLVTVSATKNPGDDKRTSHYRLQIALESKDKLSKQCVRELLKKADEGVIISILHAALYYYQKNSISDCENYLSKASKKDIVMSDDEKKLFEELCFKLAEKYEGLFITLPASFTSELDETAKLYIGKIILYFQQIPTTSTKYQEAQYRIAHFQKYFLKDEIHAMGTFQKLSTRGDSASAYSAVMLDFKAYWKRFCRQLSKEDRIFIARYRSELKNKAEPEPFFDQIKSQTDSSPTYTTSKELLEELLKEIATYNQERSAASKSIISGVNNLQTAWQLSKNAPLQNSVSDERECFEFADKFNPGIKKRFEHLWENSPKKSSQFFNQGSVLDSRLSRKHNFLQASLSLLPFLRTSLANQNPEYREILEKAYLTYLTDLCRDLLKVENSDLETTLQKNQGAIIHAI